MKEIKKIDKTTVQIDKCIYKRYTNTSIKRDNFSGRLKPPTLIYVKWEYQVTTLGELVKATRLKKHMRQHQLASKLNISKQYISLIECSGKVSYNIILTVLKELDLIIGME